MTKKLTRRPLYAIIDSDGVLYAGSLSYVRRSAIRYHAWCLHEASDGDVSEHAWSMTPGHKSSWARCKRRGDRCVRVNVYLAG